MLKGPDWKHLGVPLQKIVMRHQMSLKSEGDT